MEEQGQKINAKFQRQSFKELVEIYQDTQGEDTLECMKALLAVFHDELLQSIVVDGYLVTDNPKPFKEQISSITAMRVTPYEYKDGCECYIYMFYDKEWNNICNVFDTWLEDPEQHYKYQKQRHRQLLYDERAYFMEQETELRYYIEEESEVMRIKKQQLSEIQKTISQINIALYRCEH
jgi:hypothetical protein